jgi:hypothetical protein
MPHCLSEDDANPASMKVLLESAPCACPYSPSRCARAPQRDHRHDRHGKSWQTTYAGASVGAAFHSLDEAEQMDIGNSTEAQRVRIELLSRRANPLVNGWDRLLPSISKPVAPLQGCIASDGDDECGVREPQ